MTPKAPIDNLIQKSKFLFMGLVAFCCHTSYSAYVFQDQTSLAANVYQKMPEIASEVPPKSAIEISDPDQNTIWTVSEPAHIQWETENIGTAKSIRFFLAKDDMVVQELGSFQNNSFAEGIELAKNVGSGDNYQVVGIELFPDNKFQVAKYASPYFSIRNPVADARKATALAKRSGSIAEAEKPLSRKERRRKQKSLSAAGTGLASRGDSPKNPAVKAGSSKSATDTNSSSRNPLEKNASLASNENNSGPNTDEAKRIEEAAPRNEFEDRTISYVKDLTFSKDEITVSLWDHGREDGDIVSIYLNGEPIVSKHYLTYGKKKVSFKLDASKTNDLFLYAHNLGKAPPNTVSIELTDGSTSEKIVLNSDLKSCEAVQIKVK